MQERNKDYFENRTDFRISFSLFIFPQELTGLADIKQVAGY
jgi:hypothetical protein